MPSPGPLYEVSIVTATVGTAETAVAHGGTVAPDWVTITPATATVYYACETATARDGTNIYTIASHSVACHIKCEWFGGRNG